MQKVIINQIADLFFQRGLASQDVALSSTALLVAWHEGRTEDSAQTLFANLANRLEGRPSHEALTSAADWLRDPSLSAIQWDALENGLQLLRHTNPGPIDWTAELSACIANDRHMQLGFNLSLSLARVVTRIVDIPISESCACVFPNSATLAWILSGDREVTLYAGDRDLGIIIALMARAACRSLTVDRRNPIDGSYSPAYAMRDDPDRQPPFERFDHIVSMPYFGTRIADGPAKGMPFEAYQIERLASHATRSFSTIVTDGMLFRESRQEADLRRNLSDYYDTTVLSLPPGMFWPTSGVSTSLLYLRPVGGGHVRMIDGRTMEKTSSGRVQENLIVRHLEQFQGLHPRDESRVEVIDVDELAAANFSLLPDRYLRSAGLTLIENALKERIQVVLEDIAVIERSKAPIPMREVTEDPPIAALEIAPSDIVDGMVRTPRRQQAFEKDQVSAVSKVTVQKNDILVSIKGNIGIIGIVGKDAMLADVMNEPWIASQSLAIIRWKPNPYVPSPEILNALLTAPWVREKLESMSGGATVRTLPISAVRSLSLPVPTAQDCAQADHELILAAEMRQDIETRIQNLAQAKSALWYKLWHLAPQIEEE